MIVKSETEKSRAYFFTYYRYTLEMLERDYNEELRRYQDSQWDAPQRAARLSAAVKRYKTYEMLCFIFNMAYHVDLDYTPLVVKRLCNALFGRTGSQELIVDVFGQNGRSHRSKDSSPEVIKEVAARYRLSAHRHWKMTLRNIERVKLGYRAKIHSSRKE
ncbi:cytoplasmic protein [Klebsiella pneumoniae]|nr:cytoplasmic protein [Klebsiella pneumoniae]